MSEGHVGYDDLVALALQAVEPAEGARLIGHLGTCSECRAEYAAIEDDVRHALAATPSVAPPAGFSGRVLAAMGMTDADVAGSASASTAGDRTPNPPARSRLIPLLTTAAALIVGLVLGVGGTAAVLTGRTPVPSVSPVPGAGTEASTLVTGSGAAVGSAGVTALAGRSYLVITVTGAKPGTAYDCVVVGTDGRRRSLGSWTLESYHGSAQGSGTWAVELPEGGLARVELVTASGALWSTAVF